MKLLITSLIVACAAFAADIKSLPNQAGNGNIDLSGRAIVDPKEIEQIVGAPMAAGYIVVRIKVSPRMQDAIRINPDDFTMVSRKDGERSPSLGPSQIAGSANLTLKAGKVTATEGSRAPLNDPLLRMLESKILPEAETKEPVEGLLYFQLEGKNKPKDLGLLYKGPAGRLAMDFK